MHPMPQVRDGLIKVLHRSWCLKLLPSQAFHPREVSNKVVSNTQCLKHTRDGHLVSNKVVRRTRYLKQIRDGQLDPNMAVNILRRLNRVYLIKEGRPVSINMPHNLRCLNRVYLIKEGRPVSINMLHNLRCLNRVSLIKEGRPVSIKMLHNLRCPIRVFQVKEGCLASRKVLSNLPWLQIRTKVFRNKKGRPGLTTVPHSLLFMAIIYRPNSWSSYPTIMVGSPWQTLYTEDTRLAVCQRFSLGR